MRHHLLESERVVGAGLHGADPVAVLCSTYGPRDALGRGFVYFDWKWQNDTDDVVADLPLLAGMPEDFALRSVTPEEIAFAVLQRDEVLADERVYAEAEDGRSSARLVGLIVALRDKLAPMRKAPTGDPICYRRGVRWVLVLCIAACSSTTREPVIGNAPPQRPAAVAFDAGTDSASAEKPKPKARCLRQCCKVQEPAPDGTYECCFCPD